MKKSILLAIVGIYLSGCATVTRGTHTKMVIDTDPIGASITTDLELPSSKSARKKNPDLAPEYYGCLATPCEIKMPRRSEFIMTIRREGYEDVEIGVDSGISKQSLNANLAGSTGVGVGVGLSTAALVSGLSGGLTSATTGAVLGTAGVATGGLILISVGLDTASGAILNLRPNPIVLTLPPEGTEFEPHPKVKKIEERRAKRQKK